MKVLVTLGICIVLHFSKGNVEEGTTTAPCSNTSCLCRYSNTVYLEPSMFSLYSCTMCYHFIPQTFFKKGTKFVRMGFKLRNPLTNETFWANVTDTASPVWNTFSIAKAKDLWTTCCEAADQCCEWMIKQDLHNNNAVSKDSCPKTWDGWHCWPETPAGVTRESPCPWHVYFYIEQPKCQRFATKTCTINGTWFRKNGKNEWSDYTTCGLKENIDVLLKSHIIAFAVSVALLAPALLIFFSYKQLRVIRVSIHKNLFIAMLLNSICVIVFESYFMEDSFENGESSLIQANKPICKLFQTTTKYLRLSTYTWMFCEGLYLHKLITRAFEEQKKMALFFVIGWGFPAIFVTIWAVLRQFFDDVKCWISTKNHFEWIILTPMLLALVLNAVFLTKIVVVLVSKLKSTHANEPTQFRRALKATVALVPLFGIHIFFVMFHPNRDMSCNNQHIYNIITYVVDGIQGGVVALIFCFFNNEVINLLKRSYIRRKLVRSVGSSEKSSSSRKGMSMTPRISITTNMSVIVSDSFARYSKKDVE